MTSFGYVIDDVIKGLMFGFKDVHPFAKTAVFMT